MDYNITLNKFKEFLNNYDTNNKDIAMKISHSYHVADLANKLAKAMDLDEETTTLVKIIGLLHDLGRFIQYDKINDYNDYTTNVDHAELAINYLFVDGNIKEFIGDRKYDEIIKTAISNHNKYKIPNNLSKDEKFHTKFIRDIDKIDIFRQMATSYENKYTVDTSPKVLETLKEEKVANYTICQNESDMLLFHFMFIFDINFKESYELLDATDNLELYISTVEVDKTKEKEFEEIKTILRKYLQKKLED